MKKTAAAGNMDVLRQLPDLILSCFEKRVFNFLKERDYFRVASRACSRASQFAREFLFEVILFAASAQPASSRIGLISS